MATAIERKEEFIRGLSMPQLVVTLRAVEDGPRNPDTATVRLWLIREVERRHDGLNDAIVKYYDDNPETDLEYVEVLLMHLPTN